MSVAQKISRAAIAHLRKLQESLTASRLKRLAKSLKPLKSLKSLKSLAAYSERPAGLVFIAAILTALVILTVNNSHHTDRTDYPHDQAINHQPSNIAIKNTHNTIDDTMQPAPLKNTYKIKRGETLIKLLRRANVSNSHAHKAVNVLSTVANLRKINVGDRVDITKHPTRRDEITELAMRTGFNTLAKIKRTADDAFSAKLETIPTLALTHMVEGVIEDSLYLSAKEQGLSDKVIIEMIRLLSFDVDFQREIRTGDTFRVYYERTFAPSYSEVKDGQILKAELGMRKRTLDATYYSGADGVGEYFDENGKSTKKALMKTPLDVAVITSSYGTRRHPVLGYKRKHKGVDFRAPTGTPIFAAGHGTIERASRYGAYGNYVRIRHSNGYKTAYAHLSRYGRGIKSGKRVKQGQIIGYSGATGRVTAAHLHYEVLYDGKHVNPMTLKMPTGRALAGQERENYLTHRGLIVADIKTIQSSQQAVALAKNTLPIDTHAAQKAEAHEALIGGQSGEQPSTRAHNTHTDAQAGSSAHP